MKKNRTKKFLTDELKDLYVQMIAREPEERPSIDKILEGIQFCHKNNICHLDIKTENILLDMILIL